MFTLVSSLDKEMEQTIFQIIADSGEAKCKALEALDAFNAGDLERKDRCLKEADERIADANKVLSKLIQREAKGENIPFSILLIHSCDIMMNSITQIELIKRLTKKLTE